MNIMRRFWKRLTICRRARKRGEVIRERFHPQLVDFTSPEWYNAARTLTRLWRIMHGIKPFQSVTGWIGKIFFYTFTLKDYGCL